MLKRLRFDATDTRSHPVSKGTAVIVVSKYVRTAREESITLFNLKTVDGREIHGVTAAMFISDHSNSGEK